MTAVADHMAAFILGSLGATYLIAFVLIVARPARWRLGVWISQLSGFGATCFVVERFGLDKPLVESLAMAGAGAGVGALAAFRWDVIAEAVRKLARARRLRRRRAPRLA